MFGYRSLHESSPQHLKGLHRKVGGSSRGHYQKTDAHRSEAETTVRFLLNLGRTNRSIQKLICKPAAASEQTIKQLGHEFIYVQLFKLVEARPPQDQQHIALVNHIGRAAHSGKDYRLALDDRIAHPRRTSQVTIR